MNHAWIDVHHHLIPPVYREHLEQQGLTAGGWPTPDWSAESSMEVMDALGTATAVLSVSAPGVHAGDDRAARHLARQVNEFQAQLVADHPTRFGSFASLPLPDVEGAVTEAVHALDVLHADGVVLMSNAHGTYLGDDALTPLWQALDERAAVVFVHPTMPPLAQLPGLPGPLLDYPYDTTRTALHMVAHGVVDRFRDVKVVLSHAGGVLPFVAQRLEQGLAVLDPAFTPERVTTDLQRFWFDTALSAAPGSLPSLFELALPGHVLFGSDFPFASPAVEHGMTDELSAYLDLHPELRAPVTRGAGETLFPRLAR